MTEQPPLKLLVLGPSGTVIGREGMRTWPTILAERLQAEAGRSVDLTRAAFFVTGSDPTEYVQRQLEAADPDIVVLVCGGQAVPTRTVAARVEQRFGRAWRRRYRRVEGAANAVLRRAGPGGPLARRAARSAARSLIGTATTWTMQDALRSAKLACQVVARREAISVVLAGTSRAGQQIEQENPDRISLVQRYNAEMAKEAKRLHFDYWDMDADLVRVLSERNDVLEGDGMHANNRGNEIMADCVLPLVRAAASRH